MMVVNIKSIFLTFIGLYTIQAFVSCKALKYNDRLISFKYINESDYEIIGDFQQISFLNDDLIKVMPAYFREFGSESQSLIVRVSVNKKYGFENLGKVISKEFGELKNINHEWIKHHDKIDDIIYSISLKKMAIIEKREF